MILKSYEITNWGPHRHQKIEFPAGVKTIALVAENDQGKSWILRGIAFCLSIGRNEYGDQTAIHDGQSESTHKLVIEHNGQEHTIEKIVRGKQSEEEGTLTLLDGNKTDRAGFETWYASTLGLPHPSIWLPIVIAMQNETDFHLRKKKSEREEALRAACRLTKIDSWKDALQARTNEEDKTLIALVAELKAQIAGLEKDLKSLEEEKTQLQEKISKEENPLGDNGPTLKTIAETVKVFREATNNLKKTRLEEENHLREVTLAENAHARLITELKSIPGGSPEEEAATEKITEDIESELHARERMALEVRLTRCNSSLTKKKKRLEELGELKQSTAENLEKTLAGITQTQELLAETKKKQEENPCGAQPLKQLQEKVAELEETENRLKGEKTRILESGKTLEESLQSAKIHWKDIKTDDPTTEIEKITTLLENNLEFGTGPLGAQEAEFITLRVLEHWENHPLEDCPLCSRSFSGLTTFTDPKKRKILLADLKEEATNADEAKRKKTLLSEALSELKIALRAKERLQELNAWPNWKEAASKKSEDIISAEKARKEKSEAAQIVQTTASLEEKIQIQKDSLKTTHPEANDIESAKQIAADIRKAATERAKETAEAAGLEKEITETSERLKKIQAAGEPQEKFSELEISELEEKNQKAKEKLKEFRNQRINRTTKEKEESTAKIKVSSLQEKTKTLKDTKAQLEETIEKNPVPQAPQGTTLEDWAFYWETRAEEITGLKARIQPISEKITEKAKEKETKEGELTIMEKRVAKAAAARKLIAFLDYKHAPRKLLESICERLFATTNKIGEILQVDIRIKVGKNLDFLTVQQRNGRLIEQKTERLGFGKGAILGICFRLACQKILLPETGFLILDEPTANVDTKRKSALKAFLQNLSEETESGTKQIILVEHDEEVTGLCGARIPVGENAAQQITQ